MHGTHAGRVSLFDGSQIVFDGSDNLCILSQNRHEKLEQGGRTPAGGRKNVRRHRPYTRCNGREGWQISRIFGGFVIAFARGWLLTLVMLTSIPPLAIAGGFMAVVIEKMASRGQSAYAKAATVVEQTIGSIRIVASFTGEKQAISNYNKFLLAAYKCGIYEGVAAGSGLGLLMLIVFLSYALAIWYGGKMILEKGYSGGDVFNVIIAVLTGSISLGQASPCLSAFAAAAFKMFETINRKPEIDVYDTRRKILEDIKGDIEVRDVYLHIHPVLTVEEIRAAAELANAAKSTPGSFI